MREPHHPGTVSSLSQTAAEKDEDEIRHQEAIRALQKLHEQGSQGEVMEARVAALTRQLNEERLQREKLSSLLATECELHESSRQQVICLEKELDQREQALQAAYDSLDRREAELQQVQLRHLVAQTEARRQMALESQSHRRSLQDDFGAAAVGESLLVESRCQHMRSQLSDQEHQLDTKDQYIFELLAILRSRGVFVEEDCGTCASEGSSAMTVSTAASMGQMSIYEQRTAASMGHMSIHDHRRGSF